jgi:predicted nucleic-acid-binding Zn-ribbon protein
MEKTKKCPKCSSEMEKGLMLTPGAVVGVRWQRGEPNKWFNMLNKLPKVDAFRCVKCGYLENYVE